MNLLTISFNYIRQRLLNTLLNMILLGLGVGMIVFLLLIQHQIQQKFSSDIKGIQLVVGAKGSPLQLILCNVYQIDVPTGNIPLKDALKVMRNKRFVKKAIPLALGDSYEGFRIVGTTHDYIAHYQGKIVQGKKWKKTLEVCIGAEIARTTNLKVGSKFSGAHGLDSETVSTHEEVQYQVVGILEPAYNVLDKLILTNIESVWAVHEVHEEENNAEHHKIETFEEACNDSTTLRQITSLLITQFANPMAAINLPRIVNSIDVLQSASPAWEVNRLFELIGIGEQALTWFAYLLIIIAMLSIFMALLNTLKERQYDLAIMRVLGASRMKLCTQIVLEGLILSFLGLLFGFLIGHGLVAWIGTFETVQSKINLQGSIWLLSEWYLIVGVSLVSMIASFIPAWQVYSVDISKTLAS